MSYEVIFAAIFTIVVIALIFLSILLIVSFIIIVALFKRYDSLYKDYEDFVEETDMYSDVDAVKRAATDLLEHCEVMKGAIDHNETILFLNFKNHIERFLFQLQVIKTKTGEERLDD